MVTIDWERISNSIRHDATIQYRYTVENDHCVLGGLAVDYGVALPEGDTNYWQLTRLTRFRDALSRATGLNTRQLMHMQFLNDEYETVDLRRAALLAWVAGERINEEA